MATEAWVVNASPVITMAKTGHLWLFEELALSLLLPGEVVEEILAGPPADPARKAIEEGWGKQVPVAPIPSSVFEWGLGRGESAVIALALETRNCAAVLDDDAARRCARSLGIPLLGTLGVVLRAKRLGLIPSAADVLKALRSAGLRLDDETIRASLERSVGERWG